MASPFITANRYLYLETPLGPNQFLLTGFTGSEAISELFQFELEVLAENHVLVPFEKLIGQTIGFGVIGDVHDEGKQRDFSGIAIRISQGGQGKDFTRYRITIAPPLWLLTQTSQSRIFQMKAAPDIIKEIIEKYGITVDRKLSGSYDSREYCVQYQETDFAFVSRLMEAEGIFYFHSLKDGVQKVVLMDSSQSIQDVPDNSTINFEEISGGGRSEERIHFWEKSQDLRSGKFSLRDYYFEVPHNTLEGDCTVIGSVMSGKVNHQLKVAGDDQLEIYEYPGIYSQKYDAATSTKAAKIGMEQVEQRMMLVHGESNCRQFLPGYKFTLKRHFNGDGDYMLVSVAHKAEEGNFQSTDSDQGDANYSNTFTCIPGALAFRPERRTPRPFIRGCQTAIVVGPGGEEIFTDKYSRIKVHFFWDRLGEYDENASCWVRVATTWAGKNWGTIAIPRIGHEVIVSFLEGDPDRPIVTGSIYNADTMPPYALPDNKTRSGIKSRSSIGGDGFNEIRFEDKKDKEQIFINAQKDVDCQVGKDSRETIGQDRQLTVGRDRANNIGRDDNVTTGRDLVQTIGRDLHQDVSGKCAQHITGSLSLAADGAVGLKFGSTMGLSVGSNMSISAGGQIVLSASTGITLSVGGSHVTITPAGVMIVGPMVMINSGGAPLPGMPAQLVSPQKAMTALLADTSVPGDETTYHAQLAQMSAPTLLARSAPSHNASSNENKKKTHYVEVTLDDENGKPAAGAGYRITLPDGSVTSGSLDEKGFARVDGIDPGQVKITFPDYDKDAWSPK